jgi:GntR family transcriptional regulator, transcriptional repressor for pyruvate dehydrogenase complex
MTAVRTTGKPRRKVASGLAMKTLGRAPNLPSQVAHMISDEILAGRFQAGDQLPTERELAETFGVSRNVVREAIARLRFEGAVEPRQGSGVFVLGNQANSALRLDAEILRDRSLFTNLFELRSILEVEAAGLAAARRGRKHLTAIGAALKQLYNSQGTPEGVDADLEFHRAIARASDNAYVAIFINFISEHVRASIAQANERVDAAARGHINKEEHGAIYEAIKAKDVEGARESMRRHIAKAMGRLGLTTGWPRPADAPIPRRGAVKATAVR